MSKTPLVSAIIIFLNEERFIREAINSIFKQTYINWELLLVDDGSTDKSSEIASSYAEKYPEKVRYLEHKGHQNLGMSASRNLGVHHAKGRYIAYLDGDDIWLPKKLEHQVAILNSQPDAAMVYGPLHRWYSWNRDPENVYREDLFGAGKKGLNPYANKLVKPPNLLILFLQDEFFIPGGILVKREVIESVGGYEEVFRSMSSDTVVMVKICLTFAVFVSDKVLYKYRMHSDSCTHVSWLKGDNNAAKLFFLNWVKQYLSEKSVKDPTIWQAFRKALWRCRYAWLFRLFNQKYYFGMIESIVIPIGRKMLPAVVRRWLWVRWRRYKYTLMTAK